MNNQAIWSRLTQDEMNTLLRLLLTGKRVEGIKYVRSVGGLGLRTARDFVDSAWLCQQVVNYDPTKRTSLQEFKSEVLQVITNMLNYVNDPEMLTTEKYEFITANHIPMLLSLCTED